MGAPFESWDAVEGAYYVGAGGSWEMIWFLVSVVLCVVALWMGARHELDAYKSAEAKK